MPRLARLHSGAQRTTDFGCPYATCDGSGLLVDEETNDARPCRCRAQRINVARSAGLAHTVPPRFREVAFERRPVSEMDPEVVRQVRHFCRRLDDNLDQGTSVWFWGSRGTGKTTLAMLISKEAIKAGRTVAIYSLPDLLTEIRTTYDESSDQRYDQLMRKLRSVDLLHVDDMAVVEANAWILEQLYTVVNTRYEDERSIVFTADVGDWTRLGDHVGERTFSRLYEMAGPPIPMFGADRREELGERRGEERGLVIGQQPEPG